MPRQNATSFQNNFVGGFVTQATALDFPENAAFDQDNVIFSEIGIASRRPGFEYENNFTTLTEDRAQMAQSTYLWKNSSGDGVTNIVVQQNGGTLHFYLTGSALSLSAGRSANTVALSSFIAAGATTDNLNQNECQYSAGLGYLFVVHPYCDPFYVKYNSDGTFTAAIITFTIRDVFGIPEAVLVDNRPAALTDTHKYNLLNQGWDSTKIGTMHTALATTYPSNADVWWTFVDSSNIFNPATMLASVLSGSSPAPKGYIRLNPWSTARAATCNTQTGFNPTLSSADETSGTLRPSVTEFHAGRVWYAGVNAQGYNPRIYVSTVVQQPSDFGYCAATNDPTSQNLFDALATDGLIITIPQAGTIYRLVSLGASLLVFGANGVWVITGSQGIGFTATDFSVSPVGYTRSVSGSSFVIIENAVAWWNSTGINIVSNDPQKGISIQSMTDAKIKDFFIEDIPSTSKRFARGAYNPRTHQIIWLYTSAAPADLTSTYTFDKALCYNTLINAFYTWTIPTTTAAPNSIIVIEGAASVTGTTNVVDNSAALVVDNSAAQVITFGFSQSTTQTVTKYLTSYPSGGSYVFTFAECFNDIEWLDWFQYDSVGTDYDSFFTTGYLVKTQGERRFQANYIYIFTDLSDGAINSYTFQTLWNYGSSGDTGMWTQKQTVSQTITHDETNYDAGRRRLKVRGAGTAVQFKFSSVTGKPFNIIGWSTFDSANAHV